MRTKLFVPAIFVFIGLLYTSVAAQVKSVYTDLNKNCRTVENSHLDLVKRCHGIAGYDLLVGLYDERFDITVINPARRKFEQKYTSLITSSFSDPGGKAEWRVRDAGGKMVPFALIVRVNAQENADTSTKVTPYIAVSKITGRNVCLTDKIMPGPGQNEKARRAADASATKPCMK
jgi:hypothetical protein